LYYSVPLNEYKKTRKKFKVKCVAIGKRKFKSSKNQMEDLHESLNRKLTKTEKRDEDSKSRGLKSREKRVQKPKNINKLENL
jgi:hypothetical protein